ncbi:MAG: TolC family protein [Gammaproteobacteria bacterium]
MRWRITLLSILLLLKGCATVPPDLGRSDVDALVGERGVPVDAGGSGSRDSLVGSLTSQPLDAESAIRIALVNNPELQAIYAQLGIAAADVYAAGRIRNPVFSAAILDSNRAGDKDQLTFGLVASFTDLLTLRARQRLATAEFARMKQSIGSEVLRIAADAEAAYYRYVAARQVAALRAQIARAGLLSADLARRYHAAGNLTPRDLALQQAAAAEAQLAALEADAGRYSLRTDLATVLGLSVAGTWDAPARLPVPLEQEDALISLLALAKQSRLDLAAAHTSTDIVADRLGVTNWTRWLGELEVGAERERETDDTRLTGPTVAWEIPLFTQHRDEWLRVDAGLQIAIADVQRISIAVDNSVRLAYAATENAKARVDEYHHRLIPARMAAVERAQEEENFMLIGIFELLATKQQEYDAYQGYFETLRDYWLSRVELARAVGNSLPSSANIGDQRLDVDDYIRPQGAGKHSGHGGMGDDSRMAPVDHSQHTGKDNQRETSPVDHSQHIGKDIQREMDEVSPGQPVVPADPLQRH